MDRLSFWSWTCTRRNAAQKRRGHWTVRAGNSSTSLTAITVPENLVSIGPRRFANSWHICPLAEQYSPVHTVASRSGSANLSAAGARAALFRPYRPRSRYARNPQKWAAIARLFCRPEGMSVLLAEQPEATANVCRSDDCAIRDSETNRDLVAVMNIEIAQRFLDIAGDSVLRAVWQPVGLSMRYVERMTIAYAGCCDGFSPD